MARLTDEQIQQLREELRKDYSKTKVNAETGTSNVVNGANRLTVNPRPSTMSLFEQYHAKMLDGNSNQNGLQSPAPKKIKKRKRWQAPEQTIWSIGNVPEGWSWEEPDLDPADIDAQIIRCQERIQENILPNLFESRLEALQKRTKRKTEVSKKYPGHTQVVAERLQELEEIRRWLKGNRVDDEGRMVLDENGEAISNDTYNQLINVNTIMEQYENGALVWSDEGLVTYWHHGERISEPRPFDLNEAVKIYRSLIDQNMKRHSFWVEGLNHPGAQTTAAMGTRANTWGESVCGFENDDELSPQDPRQLLTTVQFCIANPLNVDSDFEWVRDTTARDRSPGTASLPFEFLYDTGSRYGLVYERDLLDLCNSDRSMENLYSDIVSVGLIHVSGPTGRAIGPHHLIALDSAMLTSENRFTTWWIRSMFTVVPGSIGDTPGRLRIDGPWLRWAVYSGTAPKGRGNVTFANDRVPIYNNLTPIERATAERDSLAPKVPGPDFGHRYIVAAAETGRQI